MRRAKKGEPDTKKTLYCLRLDADTKERFDAFCHYVGMTPSQAIRIFINQTLREKRIPFTIGFMENRKENDHDKR